jgi:5-methylcytosine-specific restriction endonuclease McrA
VKRAVWKRDGGQCAHVSDTGQRCPARKDLEFDHVREVALGGRATVEGIRLLCRTHNQYQAERAFGAGFMHEKRRAAQEDRAAARARAAAAD